MANYQYWQEYIHAYQKVIEITKLVNDFLYPGEYKYKLITSEMTFQEKKMHVTNDMESEEFAQFIHYDLLDNLEAFFPNRFENETEVEVGYKNLVEKVIPLLDNIYAKLKKQVLPVIYNMSIDKYKSQNNKRINGLSNEQIWQLLTKESNNAITLNNFIDTLITSMVLYYGAGDLLKDTPNPVDEILKEYYELSDLEYSRQIKNKKCSITANSQSNIESIDCNFGAFNKYFEDMFGQDKAISEIEKVLKRAILFHNAEDINDTTTKKSPLATFMFYGPTGTGKTQAAKFIADFVFNDNKKLLILDMNSYKDGKIGSSAIKGHPEGYVNSESGTDFTRFLKSHKNGVIVLDEFEKADPSVREIFMTMLDEGEFKDALGNTYDLSSYIFIATTNVNPKVSPKKNIIGFNTISQEKILANQEKEIKDGLREIFTSPIINRFNNIIHFKKIEYQDAMAICANIINHLKESFESKRFYGEVPTITINDMNAICEIILDKCDYQKDGVRSVRNVINDTIGSEIIEQILSKNYKIHISTQNGKMCFLAAKKTR